MKLTAADVFTPGEFPTHTYVERPGANLEGKLKDGLETRGQILSISGPSKSGKTVLVEKVVGQDYLIPVTGAGITDAEQLWSRALAWIDVPTDVTEATKVAGKGSVTGSAKAAAGIVVAKGEVGGTAGVEASVEKTHTETKRDGGLQKLVKEIANSSFVLLVDDFHYMARNAQEEVAKQIKEAARLGVKVCTISVPHRTDDVVRALPELRGRVTSLDLKYWDEASLTRIGSLGFEKLKVHIPLDIIKQLSSECAGSPQLMQGVCLNLCREVGVREERAELYSPIPTSEQLNRVLEDTAATANFRSLVDVLDCGPKTRGTERKTYAFTDKSSGDVYRCVLRSLAAAPPRLSFDYDEILRRVRELCSGEPPVGSSVSGSCLHMSKLAETKFPNERVIEWDEQKQVFDIADPYFLFYIRWSHRLYEE
ncbi:MAG TPA: hypothetical protein VFF73_09950 [Planctomycetota bacterium]|nr:hypothetical protein [Planctomycetota bacterium]